MSDDPAADLALVLLHDVRACDGGFHVVGLISGLEPYPSREAAEARYLDWLRRTYGGRQAVSPTPEAPR